PSIERANPAVSLADDDLGAAVRLDDQRTRRLIGQDARAGRSVRPDDLARILVEADEARRFGRLEFPRVLDAVAGDDVEMLAVPGDRAAPERDEIAGRRRKDAELLLHVELPKYGGNAGPPQQRADVETQDLAAVRDDPKPILFDKRRAVHR